MRARLERRVHAQRIAGGDAARRVQHRDVAGLAPFRIQRFLHLQRPLMAIAGEHGVRAAARELKCKLSLPTRWPARRPIRWPIRSQSCW